MMETVSKIFFILLIIGCPSTSNAIRRKEKLSFQYLTTSPLIVNVRRVSKDDSKTFFSLTGDLIAAKILHVTSIYCGGSNCDKTFQSLYLFAEHLIERENLFLLDQNDMVKLKLIFDSFSKASDKTNFTCQILNLVDDSKDLSSSNLTQTNLFGIILLALCIFLTFALCIGWFLFIYYRRFKHNRMKKKLRKVLALAVQQFLDRSPVVLYDAKTMNDDESICSICLETFDDQDELRRLNCLHCFHRGCVDPWLLAHQTCPLCNGNILENPIPTISSQLASIQ